MEKKMIIDFHSHLWDRGFLAPGFYRDTAEKWAEKAPDRTPDMIMPKLLEGIVDEDGKLYIETMDRAGVDISIINMTDMGFYWCGEDPEVPMEKQLEFYGELLKKHPDRFHFFAFFDPRRENCLELLERAAKEYACVGCGEISMKGVSVADGIMQPLFKKCLELDLPVFIHIRTGHGTEFTDEDLTHNNTGHPFHIRALQAAYPDLVIILGHAGYDLWWEEACRIARGSPNCYLELSDWYLELSDPKNLIVKVACMRDMVGADHILFGSDQVSGNRFCGDRAILPDWVSFFKKLPEEAKKIGYQFTKEEVELILGGNAKRILKL
jgi:predicted TIM-barrel fold metal-dependent hydrolase